MDLGCASELLICLCVRVVDLCCSSELLICLCVRVVDLCLCVRVVDLFVRQSCGSVCASELGICESVSYPKEKPNSDPILQ